MKKLLWIFDNWRQTQDFGQNPQFYAEFGLKGHEGIDYGIPIGTPVPFAHQGVVVKDQDASVDNYGIHVCVWDDVQEIATYYCHLSKNDVRVGQRVQAGEVRCWSGNTGRSTGPHLHFGICFTKDGVRISKENGYVGFVDPFAPSYFEWVNKNTAEENNYKGLDLNNKESMKVAVDVWADLKDGKLVKSEDFMKLQKEVLENKASTEKWEQIKKAYHVETVEQLTLLINSFQNSSQMQQVLWAKEEECVKRIAQMQKECELKMKLVKNQFVDPTKLTKIELFRLLIGILPVSYKQNG